MEKTKLTIEEVKHLAELIDLPISDKEAEKYSRTLGAVLDYVELLGKVDTSHVDSISHSTQNVNVSFEDGKHIAVSMTENSSLKLVSIAGKKYFKARKLFN